MNLLKFYYKGGYIHMANAIYYIPVCPDCGTRGHMKNVGSPTGGKPSATPKVDGICRVTNKKHRAAWERA